MGSNGADVGVLGIVPMATVTDVSPVAVLHDLDGSHIHRESRRRWPRAGGSLVRSWLAHNNLFRLCRRWETLTAQELVRQSLVYLVPLVVGAVGWIGRRWYLAEGPLWSSLRHQKQEIEELREQLQARRLEIVGLDKELDRVGDLLAIYRRELIAHGIDVPVIVDPNVKSPRSKED